MVPEEVVAVVFVAVDGIWGREKEEEEEEEGEEGGSGSHGGSDERCLRRSVNWAAFLLGFDFVWEELYTVAKLRSTSSTT